MENNIRFRREYHVPSDYSLYDFKQFIAYDLTFDDTQQSVFFLLGEDDEKVASYALFDMGHGSMDMIMLSDLVGKGMKKLLYTFDFFNTRSLIVEYAGERDRFPRVSYPYVAQSKGNAPGQFFEIKEDDFQYTETFDDDDEDLLYQDESET
jgi:hypothetical protein